MRRKLVVVSNRGPVTFATDDAGRRVTKRGGGGLVTALSGLIRHHDVTWIASAMSDEDRRVVAETPVLVERGRDGSDYRLRLVVHNEDAYRRFYNVVANPVLWFLQSYLWDFSEAPTFDPTLHEAWNEGYTAVNRAFAEAVLVELGREPGASVFFHDYHLYLAPALVRTAAPGAMTSHFVHIPWPQPDYWRVLPNQIRSALYAGILANDVIGFHTRRWSDNFLHCCSELVDVEVDWDRRLAHVGSRTVHVRTRPISVDPAEFAELATSPAVLREERDLVARRPEVLVLRVDRTDLTKNIVRGFHAYELYLDANPKMHGLVGFLAQLDPSRQDISQYASYLKSIIGEVRRINERFETERWRPIELSVEDNFPRSVAAYKQYDVLLVNALFDGMNLIAKEAPLVNTRGGVLILSDTTGASAQLAEWALSVNPLDVVEQAQAIETAVDMAADERRSRIEGIRRHVETHDISQWIADQLDDLDAAVVDQEGR